MSNTSFFEFHCPIGGEWYGCSTGSKFVGCCTTDPCTNGCVQGDIRPGGYNVSHHGEWPDASCGSASDFYTCSSGDTFWGCCKTNACAATPPATCAQGDLVPAFMERPEQFNVYAPASASPTSAPSSKSNTGVVVGGVVGGVLFLAIIGALIFFVIRKRRNQKLTAGDMGAAAMVPMMQDEKPNNTGSIQYGGQSPPPTYTAPVQDAYRNGYPTKGHQSYEQYANNANDIQELAAEAVPGAEQRLSELPADVGSSKDTRRVSELPIGVTGTRAAELESPQISPMPLQSEFTNDMAKRLNRNQGLGLTTEEPAQRN
ncbi:hypothetical protein EJ02DRAFT_417865 [Clathrospora elynae]|uniref:Uncharacterized protein n=1 Tax=Clathrospora elynae TaxID=706981 RepID=A0A6A5T532_9PLEO|nr:hypothetical protein EJ02DRAFT_417865 [Clathrospora elynae]